MKTRTKTVKAVVKDSQEISTPKVLPESDKHAPHTFLLPDSISKDATIVLLPHPRTLKATRYYHCKQTGFYEIKKISSDSRMKRSLLLAPASSNSTSDQDGVAVLEGYVVKTASFFAVTPIDPLFLLLPALAPESKTSKEHKSMLLSLDDHMESLGSASGQLSHVCSHPETLQLVERRLVSVCDKFEAGDENMYRLDHGKLLAYLVSKAEKMVKAGLPPSMEAHFVKKPLDVPAAYMIQEEENITVPSLESKESSDDTQTTTSSTSAQSITTSPSSQSTTLTIPDQDQSQTSQTSYTATASIRHTLRLRVALNFLFASYIPAHLVIALEDLLTKPTSPIDFTPLTAHLSRLGKLREELNARAHETMAVNSHKRVFEDDFDRETKRAKKEEDERKRKAAESRGVRDLKKVNVSGMKKMSDFFAKK